MKKVIIAILAALMLAGALSAVSGSTSVNTLHSVAIVGEGSSPFPVVLSSGISDREISSLPDHF
ncbi:MAG TPA: hypothetical protein VL240_12355 [Candidatus Binatia bacterium]|nr:hypothetical protein [Candidatus Binatia bacterium]